MNAQVIPFNFSVSVVIISYESYNKNTGKSQSEKRVIKTGMTPMVFLITCK